MLISFQKILLNLSVLLTVSASALADEPSTCQAPIPVALTLSGGVSLGAYQAGALFYSSLVLKKNPELFETRLLTAASAGALNALFAVFSVCGEETKIPSESAFYRAWVGFKGQDLLAQRGENESLFSRNAFREIANELEKKWNKGLPTTCDVVLGLSVTRLKPLNDLSSIGFSRAGEKITLRIRGQGAGRPPRLTNFVNPVLFPRPLLLDLERANDAQNFAMLRQTLFASSAFPIAFAPQVLRTCVAKSGEAWAHLDLPFTCPRADIEEAKFVDGGILDNKPLALAEKISRTGLVADSCGRSQWREIPGTEVLPDKTDANVLYLYSDLSATSYEKPKAPDDLAFSIAPMLLGSVFNSSRNQDSSSLMEQSPTLENQIAAPKNNVPRMGDSLLGFFGFFERDFRAFDFYLGYWESREYFNENFRLNLRRGAEAIGQRISLPEIDANSIDGKKVACIDATLKQKRAKEICSLIDDANFVTLVRLADARFREKKTDFQFMVRWLANENYEYRDLNLRGSEAWRAPAKIKSESIEVISHLANGQNGIDRVLVKTVGPVALNLIEPLPIQNDVVVLFGPQTLITFSSLQGESAFSRLRWNIGVGLENLEAWLGPDRGRVISTPFTGLEIEPLSLNSAFVQTRFSLSGGYKFGDRDSGVVTRVGASITFVERVRIELDGEAMPFQKTGNVPWQVLPSIGLQFYF